MSEGKKKMAVPHHGHWLRAPEKLAQDPLPLVIDPAPKKSKEELDEAYDRLYTEASSRLAKKIAKPVDDFKKGKMLFVYDAPANQYSHTREDAKQVSGEEYTDSMKKLHTEGLEKKQAKREALYAKYLGNFRSQCKFESDLRLTWK